MTGARPDQFQTIDAPFLRTLPLAELKRWVLWRYEFVGAKDKAHTAKIPYRPTGRGKASSMDPNDWGTLEEALTNLDTFDGVGFCLEGSGWVGIDLDHCYSIKTGRLDPKAQLIIDSVPGYVEITPSGTGVRVLVRGSLPPGRRKVGNLEAYDSGRYLTVTGRGWPGREAMPTDDQTEALHAFHKRLLTTTTENDDDGFLAQASADDPQGRFAALWSGDFSEYPSQSEADLALCSMLARWTNDIDVIDRLFRRSGLVRDKWLERHGRSTYGRMTIEKSLIHFGNPVAGVVLHDRKYQTISADGLLGSVFSDPPWIIPDILPHGLLFMGGKAKVGKSWLCLSIAKAVGSGGVIFGKQVERGKVLYLSLEEERRSLQKRLQGQEWGRGVQVDFIPSGDKRMVGDLALPANITQLEVELDRGGYRLVVIDTFSRAFSGDQNDIAVMTAVLDPLHVMALTRDCAIIIVDHHTKMAGGGDGAAAVTDILGSTAKGAVADTLWGVYGGVRTGHGVIYGTSRMLQDIEINLEWNRDVLAWDGCLATEDPTLHVPKVGPAQMEVLQMLTDSKGYRSVADICTVLDKGSGAVRSSLKVLLDRRMVDRVRQDDGSYTYCVTADWLSPDNQLPMFT